MPIALHILSWGILSAADKEIRIGITYSSDDGITLEAEGIDKNGLYRKAVEANGGTVVALFQHHPREATRARFNPLEGVLLPGGFDVDPKFYGEVPHAKLGKYDADLDQLEFDVLEYARDHALPVLAICRGLQVLNVFYGGSLYQDIPSELEGTGNVLHQHPTGVEKPAHDVSIREDSILREIIQGERFTVDTSHHQAVKRVAPGFRVTATSDDGLAEAIERDGGPFILGVQFHPEKTRGQDVGYNALFKRFVEEAAQVASKRGRSEAP